jgi:hypothetical protein
VPARSSSRTIRTTFVLRAIRDGGPPPVPRVAKTLARRPTCFHGLAHACLLDPPCLAGCSPEPASHMPPIDFCNRVAPRAHAYEPPNPAGGCLRSDLLPAARAWQGGAGRSPSKPGVARRRIAVSTPARRPLAVRIYPSSTSSRTPSCRDANTGGDWKMSPAATCGRGTSLARGSARLGSARPRPGHDQWPWAAVRAAPLRATRMARRSAAPRVPSTHPILAALRRSASWSEGRRLGRRVSPVRRSLPARHLFYRSVRGPDWVRGAFGSTFAFFSPVFAGAPVLPAESSVPPKRHRASLA